MAAPYGKRVEVLVTPRDQAVVFGDTPTYSIGVAVDGRRRPLVSGDSVDATVSVEAFLYRAVFASTPPVATVSTDPLVGGVEFSADGYMATATFPADAFDHGRYFLRFHVSWPSADPAWVHSEEDELVVL